MNTVALAELLRVLYREVDEKLRAEYSRSLPFQDGLFDRWDRAERLGFGKGTSVYNSALVYGDVRIGEHSWIGPYTILDGSAGRLSIGSYCSVSCGVHIYTHDTVAWALSGGVAPKRIGVVTIGDCVYIGSQSVIACNVQIGSQVVVAANSFVNRDVAPRTVVAGSPAKPIGVVVGDGADVRLRITSRSSAVEG